MPTFKKNTSPAMERSGFKMKYTGAGSSAFPFAQAAQLASPMGDPKSEILVKKIDDEVTRTVAGAIDESKLKTTDGEN